MTRFYQVVRPQYERAGKQAANNELGFVDAYSVQFHHVGMIPARSVDRALTIAKALGHRAPIVRPMSAEEIARHTA